VVVGAKILAGITTLLVVQRGPLVGISAFNRKAIAIGFPTNYLLWNLTAITILLARSLTFKYFRTLPP